MLRSVGGGCLLLLGARLLGFSLPSLAKRLPSRSAPGSAPAPPKYWLEFRYTEEEWAQWEEERAAKGRRKIQEGNRAAWAEDGERRGRPREEEQGGKATRRKMGRGIAADRGKSSGARRAVRGAEAQPP